MSPIIHVSIVYVHFGYMFPLIHGSYHACSLCHAGHTVIPTSRSMEEKAIYVYLKEHHSCPVTLSSPHPWFLFITIGLYVILTFHSMEGCQENSFGGTCCSIMPGILLIRPVLKMYPTPHIYLVMLILMFSKIPLQCTLSHPDLSRHGHV
jgi:hypothetical protein